MLINNLFICGSTSFHSEDQDEETPMSANSSPSSTPRRSRFCKRNGSNDAKDKNPYAARGLDKFSALLADLEEKRRKIYAENGSDPDVSFVRFVYKNSNDLVPVVVKLKDNNANTNKKKKESKTSKCSYRNTATVKEIRTSSDISQDKFATETSVAVEQVKTPRSQSNDNIKKRGPMMHLLRMRRRPSYYLPIVLILILVLLAFFGRSVAILCTSIGWYVVPTLKESSSRTSSVKKKDNDKILSEKKVVTC